MINNINDESFEEENVTMNDPLIGIDLSEEEEEYQEVPCT
jgi:hypothetical protein